MITDSVKVPESKVKVYRYDIGNGMAVWMDCGGSNALKIAEQFHEKPLNKDVVRMIVATRTAEQKCNAYGRAEEIGKKYNVGKLPVVEVDFRTYEEAHGVQRGDLFRALKIKNLESMFDRNTEPGDLLGRTDPVVAAEHQKLMNAMHCDPDKAIQTRADVCNILLERMYETMDREGIKRDIPIFAAGGMALLSELFVKAFYILNVHPGDLTKHEIRQVYNDLKKVVEIYSGGRSIVGDAWIPPARAIAAGHEALYSTMHTMVHEMDAGAVHMRGYPLPIDYNWLKSKVDLKNPETLQRVGSAAQETLKHIGDHVIAGATFLDLFEGRWGMHESGALAYRTGPLWHLAPNGIMIQDHVIYHNGITPFKRDDKFIDGKVNEFHDAVAKISKGG